MSDAPDDKSLPPSLRRGHDLSSLLGGSKKPSRGELARAWWKRGRVIVAGVVALVLTGLGLANSWLDLWDRTGGSAAETTSLALESTGGIDIDIQSSQVASPPDQDVWVDGSGDCSDMFTGEPIDPTMDGTEPHYEDEGVIDTGDDPIGVDGNASNEVATPGWFLPEAVDLPAAPTDEELLAMGAVQEGNAQVRMYWANRTDQPVLIADLTLEVVARQPVPDGTVISIPGGDPEPITMLDFSLAEAEPVARMRGADCTPGVPFFESYALEVQPATTEVVMATVNAVDCWCLVRLHAEYWHDGAWQKEIYPPAEETPLSVAWASTPLTPERVYSDDTFLGGSWEEIDCSIENENQSGLCAYQSGG